MMLKPKYPTPFYIHLFLKTLCGYSSNATAWAYMQPQKVCLNVNTINTNIKEKKSVLVQPSLEPRQAFSKENPALAPAKIRDTCLRYCCSHRLIFRAPTPMYARNVFPIALEVFGIAQ